MWVKDASSGSGDQFELSLSMEKQQQRKHLSFTSHQDLEQLQLQYLFVWGIPNILFYPPFLNRNFLSKQLLKAQFSNTPVQRKTLWMESAPFSHLAASQLNLIFWQPVGSESLQHCHGTRKNYCPCLRMPSQNLPKVTRVGLWPQQTLCQAIGLCEKSGSSLVAWSGAYLWSTLSQSSVLSEKISFSN